MRIWSYVDGHWEEGEHGTGPHWFDVHKADEAALRGLATRYSLHQLAIDDCLSPYLHTPKLEDFERYLFIILADMVDGSEGPEIEELDCFLGEDFLITYRDRAEPPPAIEALCRAIEQGVAVRPGASGLFYEVADRTVDAMIPRVAAMSAEIDEIEDRIFTRGNMQDHYRDVLARRGLAGHLRRLLTPELQSLVRLGRGEFPMIGEDNRPYFRDVYDHLLRVDLGLEEVREDTEVALNMYLSSLNNRLSEVMKVLAIVSALALPGTLITGVFGTNFDNVPGLHSNQGFALMVTTILGTAAGMGWFFRHRGWF
ncbi:MAG: magnesium transporter CorA family protein [Dehalococcoidia bacterium]